MYPICSHGTSRKRNRYRRPRISLGARPAAPRASPRGSPRAGRCRYARPRRRPGYRRGLAAARRSASARAGRIRVSRSPEMIATGDAAAAQRLGRRHFMAEQQADRQPGIMVGRGGGEAVERSDEDRAGERTPRGELGGDAAADAEADGDDPAARKAPLRPVVNGGASSRRAAALGLPSLGRIAAIVEGDDVRRRIEIVQIGGHRLRIPGIAAEAEDHRRQPLRPGPRRRRDVQPGEAFAGRGLKLKPRGARRRRSGRRRPARPGRPEPSGRRTPPRRWRRR